MTETNDKIIADSLHRGYVYLEKGDYENAKKDYLTVLEREPQNSSAAYYMGVISAAYENFDDVFKYFNIALLEDTYTADIYGFFADIYYNVKNEPEKSFEYANKAIELNTEYSLTYFSRGSYYLMQKKDYDKAIDDFEKALQLDSKISRTHRWCGLAYLKRGYKNVKNDKNSALSDIESAIKHYKIAYSLGYEDSHDCIDRGMIYYSTVFFAEMLKKKLLNDESD